MKKRKFLYLENILHNCCRPRDWKKQKHYEIEKRERETHRQRGREKYRMKKRSYYTWKTFSPQLLQTPGLEGTEAL